MAPIDGGAHHFRLLEGMRIFLASPLQPGEKILDRGDMGRQLDLSSALPILSRTQAK